MGIFTLVCRPTRMSVYCGYARDLELEIHVLPWSNTYQPQLQSVH